MIVILKDSPNPKQLDNLKNWLRSMGLEIHESQGVNSRVLGLVGDTSGVDIDLISALDIVREVKRVQEPFKKAGRAFHPLDITVDVGGVPVGGGHFTLIAGPGAVTGPDQVLEAAEKARDAGAAIFKAAAFKPRTSPYTFHGLGREGIALLLEAKRSAGIPVMSVITDPGQLDLFADVDLIELDFRAMQNFELLRILGKTKKPVLLRRGACASLEEWLMSAEYLLDGGNENVILCDGGIRTFESSTPASLDPACVPALHALSPLPVLCDPSTACGKAALVPSVALAAAAAGCDGLVLSVSADPQHALTEGPASLSFDRLKVLSARLDRLRGVLDKESAD